MSFNTDKRRFQFTKNGFPHEYRDVNPVEDIDCLLKHVTYRSNNSKDFRHQLDRNNKYVDPRAAKPLDEK